MIDDGNMEALPALLDIASGLVLHGDPFHGAVEISGVSYLTE